VSLGLSSCGRHLSSVARCTSDDRSRPSPSPEYLIRSSGSDYAAGFVLCYGLRPEPGGAAMARARRPATHWEESYA
jgi:hypothetical protein